MKALLIHIDKLKSDLSKLIPLEAERQQKLDKKFRLEWNYNSNHIEGNTLTYGETELLLIFGETSGNHEFREYEEMKGHDIALKLVEELAFDKERNISESFIRELNKVILKEPFYKEAITPDGQPTRRLIKIGEYKSYPNSVRLQTGELFNYASPVETPALMADLLDWFQKTIEDKRLHPVELAAELHYKFVCIHPFDDGNGRISRLIMNYHLLKNGYPPVIIKAVDKKNYLFALHQADTGNIEAFKAYIAEQLQWSYEISIKAAKGQNIDEVGDWEKKLKLLNQNIESSLLLNKKKSAEVLSEVFNTNIFNLTDLLLHKWESISELFFERSLQIKIADFGSTGQLKKSSDFKGFFEQLYDNKNFTTSRAELNYYLNGFKKNGKNAFNVHIIIIVSFQDYFYEIKINGLSDFTIDKYYHQNITNLEKDLLATAITDLIIKKYESQLPPLV